MSALSKRSLYTVFNLMFMCLAFTYGIQSPHQCDCRQYHCDISRQCAPENNCRKENVALGKEASMSSGWNGNFYPACLAVNGNTSTQYSGISSGNPNCANSDTGGVITWSVDLSTNYSINSITIYPMSAEPDRLRGAWITVDGIKCWEFDPGQTISNPEEIVCSTNLTGRRVTIHKDIPPSSNDFLAFCEVQIWACLSGYYGRNCSSTCGNCTGGDGACDPFIGECRHGCQNGYKMPNCDEVCSPGKYGLNCSETCGNCYNGTGSCDPINGTCLHGCQRGWMPSTCKTYCNSGKYGLNCNSTCGHCSGSGTCDPETGTCRTGCDNGWTLQTCDKECDSGTYGPNCSNKCGYCNDGNSSCDPVLGYCHSGCQTGWLSLTCDTQLMENDSEDFPVGGIVGGVLGAFAIVVVVVVIVILLRRRKLSNRDKLNSTNSEIARKKSTGVEDKKKNERFKPPVPVKPHHPALSGPECTEQANDESSTYNIIEEELNSNDNTHHEYRNVLASRESVVSATRVSIYPSKSNHQTERDAFNHKEQYVYARVELKHTKSEISDAPSVRSKPLVPKKPEGVRISGANTIEIKQLEENDNDEYEDDTKDVYNNEDIYSTYKLQKRAPVFDALQQSLLDSLSSNTLSTQFKELKKDMKYPNSSGQIPANAKKNRFKVLCPYDYNRVILERYEGDSETDYINASYIKGYKRDNAYIAAQGPRRHTVNDMWLMIWQENITHVIMLTNLKEDGKDKCEKYWPDNGRTQKYGHVIVSGINVEMRDDYIIRMFSLQVNGNTLQKHVEQYHYLAWPDHGVPRAMSLVNYWRYVRDRASKKVPLLVHCSAGVGRTGTYIALDIAMDMSAHTLDINVQKIVLSLREERHLMVQAEAQYKFLFEVILEAYTSRSTRLTSDQFIVKFHKTIDIHETSSVIDEEFEMLQQIGKFVPKPTFSMASAEENIFKNRNPDALPEDNQLAYVGVPVNGRNMYINAVFLSSFKHQRNILLTQLPLPDTLVDIWRLVDDKDVNLIVSLSSEHEDDTVENYCQYWPRVKAREITSGPYTVKLTGSRDLGHNTTSYHLTYMRETRNKQCRVLHYTNWSGEVPDNTEEIIHLVETINVARSENDSCPVLIQCIDGAAKSGLFCIIWENLIRLKHDHENDIYLTARKVRTVRPQAVNSQVQYRFCYKVAQDYQHNAGVYQNT